MIDAVKFLMERAAKEPHVVDRYALERAASALEAEMDANTFAHHRYRRAHTCRDCGQAVWHDCEVEVEAEMKGEAACQHPRTRRHMQPAASDDRTCLDCGLMLTTPAKPEPVARLSVIDCETARVSVYWGRLSTGVHDVYSAPPGTVPRTEYEALMDAATEASDHLHESYARGTDRGCRGNTPCPVEARLDVALRHADEVLGRKP